MLILMHICFIHGHAISYYFIFKKRRHIRHSLVTVRPRIFAPHFFTIEDISLRPLTSGKTKVHDENKVSATEQGSFYWERRLCSFWILYKESITILLVSLVHLAYFSFGFYKKWHFQIQPKKSLEWGWSWQWLVSS